MKRAPNSVTIASALKTKNKNKMELKKSNVEFLSEIHQYTIDGKTLIGVTSLLSKHGITEPFPDTIPKQVLEFAATRGSNIHKICEMFDDLGVLPTLESGYTDEEIQWATPYFSLGLDVRASEFLVSDNEIVATMIDKIASDFGVLDIKTTSKVDTKSVTWQCSIGAYLLEKQCGVKVPYIKCVHLRKGKAKVIDLKRISDDEIGNLLFCEEIGALYSDLKNI